LLHEAVQLVGSWSGLVERTARAAAGVLAMVAATLPGSLVDRVR
jgi:hypothetical protein